MRWSFERAGQRIALEVNETPGGSGWQMALRVQGDAPVMERFATREMVQSYLSTVQDTLRDRGWMSAADEEAPARPQLVPVGRGQHFSTYGAINGQVKTLAAAPSPQVIADAVADLVDEPAPAAASPASSSAPADDVYDLSNVEPVIPSEWKTAAIYTLEFPARCPHCREPVKTLRAMRLRRAQVSFTSTLPRGGTLLACPLCERIISANISGLI